MADNCRLALARGRRLNGQYVALSARACQAPDYLKDLDVLSRCSEVLHMPALASLQDMMISYFRDHDTLDSLDRILDSKSRVCAEKANEVHRRAAHQFAVHTRHELEDVLGTSSQYGALTGAL
jgi:hypothetical protein